MPQYTINIVQGDYGYPLNFTLQNNAGTAIDLTGATVSIKVQKLGQDAVKFTGTLSLDTPASGTCHYQVAQTDFDEEGKYRAEVSIAFPGGSEVLSFANITIIAAPKLPAA